MATTTTMYLERKRNLGSLSHVKINRGDWTECSKEEAQRLYNSGSPILAHHTNNWSVPSGNYGTEHQWNYAYLENGQPGLCSQRSIINVEDIFEYPHTTYYKSF